ncbi:hypothetical protein [Bacillus sp. USDA818B3_A]|uniref:hypothetical protein n=1 Tax=Bacillus sp. USDA818B3_A TaxID=2698834 RepID=UPI00136F77F8|nr:hypothetical protein [Bacillus sp. USDA818B3_A]
MDPNIREERKRIFRDELSKLKEGGYLSEALFETISKAHDQFHLDVIKDEEPLIKIKSSDIKPMPVVSSKPVKVKKTLTPEEIRERNITWSLNIGVIFLLIGGLFVATSNWESMTGAMKSGSIAIVSLLFYGIAFFTKRVLHIDKTAFAFTVLGSLFLPIFILSLGWFGLLGTYLSIQGGGRYLLGMLVSFLPLIVYILFAKNLSSRLFVWFSFVSFSIGFAFILAALHLQVDFFYLGMVLFNAVLIVSYRRIKHIDVHQIFIKEFVPYIQVNLVLTTLFMLFLFDYEVINSINILLTSVVYLSMMYVTGRKEYHFVFTIMLVYGAYQLVENSFLEHAGGIIYALVAFGIAFVPNVINDRFSLEKVFQYTSAIISGFAFIYISLEGILLRSGEPAIVLMLAYLIMAANFIYLCRQSSRNIFPYLSTLFLSSAIYEGISLAAYSFEDINFPLRVCMTGFLLFILFGIVHISKHVLVIRHAAVEMGLSIMGIAILSAIAFAYWWEIGVMLLFLTVAAYLLHQYQERAFLKEAALWILPSGLGLSVAAFGEEMNVNSLQYFSNYGYAVNFATGAVIVLLTSIVWEKVNKKGFSRSSLLISQALYTLALFFSMVSPINQTWVQPIVMLSGIAMYSYFYKMMRKNWIPYFISVTTLFSYFSVINAIAEKIYFNQVINSLVATVCAMILLIIAALWRKKDPDIEAAFAWVGHIFLPLALAVTWFVYHADSVFSFLLALAGYTVSTKWAVVEWKLKCFLYGSFTTLFLVISTGVDKFNLHMNGRYEFPITSLLISGLFLITNQGFKRRITFYLVPFSTIGIGSMLVIYPYGFIPYLVTCLYIIGLLCYLHKVKWDIFCLVPLGFSFIATVEYTYVSDLTEPQKMLTFAMAGILLLLIGQALYKKLLEPAAKFWDIKMDGYTVIALFYFSFMYSLESQQIWSSVLPGTLIALSLWLQRKRVPAEFSAFITIAAGGYLLEPYYAIISRISIPSLWQSEAAVLPFIVLVIFIRHCLHGKFSRIIKAIQWLVLVIVSLILIQDAMTSHTIYDAIILGSLSLLSMVAGMYIQIKSYFFVGAGVLLLNVFLQTRPYWGNMPWWAYLLIAGLTLITIASFNEWHKQKVQKGESTFITYIKMNIIGKIRKWD